MSLPVSLGGFGMPIAASVADAAFFASCFSSLHLQSQMIGVESLKMPFISRSCLDNINQGLSTSLQVLPHSFSELRNFNKLQHKLAHLIHLKTQTSLMASAKHPRNLAVLKSSALKGSGDFLQLLPSKFLNQHLESLDFQMLCRYRVGIPIYPQGTKTCQLCKGSCDGFGDHASYCSTGGGLIRRHDRIRDYLVSECRKCGFQVEVESRNVFTYNSKKPGDLKILSIEAGEDLLVDVAVTSSFNNITEAAKTSGYNADLKEKNKIKKYEEDMNDLTGIKFTPFVMETMGGRGAMTEKLLLRIAMAQSYLSGVTTSVCLSNIKRGLTAVFSKQMAQMWKINMELNEDIGVIFDQNAADVAFWN
jgi:hypothetical protein